MSAAVATSNSDLNEDEGEADEAEGARPNRNNRGGAPRPPKYDGDTSSDPNSCRKYFKQVEIWEARIRKQIPEDERAPAFYGRTHEGRL